jgi:flavodoxin
MLCQIREINSSNMKTLIAYYSFTRNNEKLAYYLQQQLNCDILKIETQKKYTGFSILFNLVFKRKPALKALSLHLDDYDHVIFVAPVWAGRIAMPLTALLINQRTNIKEYSFITLCGGRPGQKEKIEHELWAILNKKPVKLVELWINELLPAHQKNTRHSSDYRIDAGGFGRFETEIRNFIREENLVNGI